MNLTDRLSCLYRSYGYRQYKMNKFEEYDLYARNKDFLLSSRIISFTDTNGKLMALKPDVTLSIIKNSNDDTATAQRMYYNENVYRVSKGTGTFKENLQTGLECIGQIDDYCIFETIMLAGLSLSEISEDYVLDISNLDIIPYMLDRLNVPADAKEQIVSFIENKNIHDLTKLCEKYNVPEEGIKAVTDLISAYGKPEAVMQKLRGIPEKYMDREALDKLSKISKALDKELSGKVNIDFSVMSDIKYYNGFIFKGFISGVPTAVLTGGQYDNLLSVMGRKTNGLGFAVYMDTLEGLNRKEKPLDADVLLLYDNDTDPGKLFAEAAALRAQGKSVVLQRSVPDDGRFGEVKNIG